MTSDRVPSPRPVANAGTVRSLGVSSRNGQAHLVVNFPLLETPGRPGECSFASWFVEREDLGKDVLWMTCRIMSQIRARSQLFGWDGSLWSKRRVETVERIQREVHFWLFRKSAFGSHDARWQHLKYQHRTNPSPSVLCHWVWPAIFEKSSRQQQVGKSGMDSLTADLQGSAPICTWSCKAHGHKAEAPKTRADQAPSQQTADKFCTNEMNEMLETIGAAAACSKFNVSRTLPVRKRARTMGFLSFLTGFLTELFHDSRDRLLLWNPTRRVAPKDGNNQPWLYGQSSGTAGNEPSLVIGSRNDCPRRGLSPCNDVVERYP